MKKFLATHYDDLIRAILLIGCIIALCCCSSKKPDQDITDKSLIVTDTHSLKQSTVITLPIRDYLFVRVPMVSTAKPECDTLCRKYLVDYLRSLRLKKTSGANEFGVLFDEKKNELVLYAKIGKTEDRSLKLKDARVEIRTEKQTILRTERWRYTPIIVQVFAWIGVFASGWASFSLYRKFKPKLPLP